MKELEDVVSAFTTRRSLGVSSKSRPFELCTQISPMKAPKCSEVGQLSNIIFLMSDEFMHAS